MGKTINDPINTLGEVSRELENISAQVKALLFLSGPTAETADDKLDRGSFEAYICGITDHIKRLVTDCDMCFLEFGNAK